MEYNIALLPGDGIGPEIVREAALIMEKVGERFNHKFNFTEADVGGSAIDKYGEPLPQKTMDICLKSDGVFLGAVGGAVGGNKWDELPADKRPEQALFGLRSGLGLYVNLRPAVLHKSLKEACPLRSDIAEAGIDIMVVRELTGGIYFGERGRKQTDRGEAAWDTEFYSYEEIRRIAVAAFDIAMLRNKKVTSVDKANVLESSRLWREVVREVAKDYPQVALEHMYVDNASMQLIRDPRQFDVIVTSNMFGDILSDEASQLTGSIGMLPSASIGVKNPGMYEPIHGSAPDIAGKGIANPIATIMSAAMMLKYSFKLEDEAKAIEDAVAKALEGGYRTGDIMSSGMKQVGTKEMGSIIAAGI